MGTQYATKYTVKANDFAGNAWGFDKLRHAMEQCQRLPQGSIHNRSGEIIGRTYKMVAYTGLREDRVLALDCHREVFVVSPRDAATVEETRSMLRRVFGRGTGFLAETAR